MSPMKTALGLVGIALFVVAFWVGIGFAVAAMS